MNDDRSNNPDSRWLLAAMAAPLTQAASNCSWPAAVAVGVLCGVVCLGLERLTEGAPSCRWIGAVQWLWMLLLMSEFLHWSMLCWPQHKSYCTVPLVLLALAAWSSCRGTEKAAAVGGAVYWFLVILLGTVLFSAVREVRAENLKPEWGMQTAHLITVLLIPAMGLGAGTGKRLQLTAYTLLVSVITVGVLSLEMVRRVEAPFYEMSRGISLLGMGQRFESLVAAAMTLGYFVLISYLLTVTANAWEMGKRQGRSIWISALFTALVFLSGMRLNSRLLALGTMLAWVLLPMLEKIVKILKKGIDK